MRKKLNGKLMLNRETLRTLNGSELANVGGGFPTEDGACTTGGSNTNNTCETCFGPSCKRNC